MTEKIYRSYGQALGDGWLSLNYLINFALEQKQTLKVSLFYRKGPRVKRADKLKEMLPLFQHNELIELGEWEPTEPKVAWSNLSKYPCMPTVVTWSPNKSRRICYQFDAKSHKGQAFPSKEAENELLKEMAQGYELVRLGSQKTLRRCMEDLATCEIFVGVDSGMAHMAACVGTPLFYCQNNRDNSCWDTVHSNKVFVLGKDHLETINHINNYKKLGLEYYKANARHLNPT